MDFATRMGYYFHNYPGIYLIVHKESHRAYVGQSTNVAKRCGKWFCDSGNTGRLGDAIRLHGKYAWDVYVVERVDNLELLNEREQWWMDALESTNPEFGYNVVPAHGTRYDLSIEEKQARVRGAKLVMEKVRPPLDTPQ